LNSGETTINLLLKAPIALSKYSFSLFIPITHPIYRYDL
jgi:hypothetical protein